MSETASPTSNAPGEQAFQADVNQVLDLVIHSLYSNPEIFLRELISNGSDALDRLRILALTEHGLLSPDEELRIRLVADKDAKTLTIIDNGAGMTPDEMAQNLGTIAHSGSKAFLAALKEKGDAANQDLIGQFGVGFYSAFLVAHKVEVTSLAASAAGASTWTSEAKGTYTIEPAPEKTDRGTEIKLHLKEDHEGFAEEFRIRELVRKYSDFVGHPIELQVTREEGEDDEKTTVIEFEKINQGKALWMRSRDEITDEQYREFYQHLTYDWEKPLAHKHFKAEGTQMFTGLLFLPGRPPFDLFDRAQRRGVRLYVKRVFIMDDCKELLPEWLRFVRGVIDSDDLPLNVSRELLQEDRTVRTIKKVIVRRTLDLIEELTKAEPEAVEGEDGESTEAPVVPYRKFWDAFGSVLKEGLHEEPEQKDRIAELIRYSSTASEWTSLAEYVERMPEEQTAIYYVMGPDRATVEASPHLEALKKKGYEVLFMTDAVDEWAVQGLSTYDEKPLVSAMKSDLDMGEQTDAEKEKAEESRKEYEGFLEKVQSSLDETISEVRISRRLTDSPACLVVPEGGMHSHIERMIRAQQGGMPATKRIFEINPDHAVVQRLRALHDSGNDDQRVNDWIRLLHDQALLSEGSPVPDAPGFARRMTQLMSDALPGKGDSATEGKQSEAAG